MTRNRIPKETAHEIATRTPSVVRYFRGTPICARGLQIWPCDPSSCWNSDSRGQNLAGGFSWADSHGEILADRFLWCDSRGQTGRETTASRWWASECREISRHSNTERKNRGAQEFPPAREQFPSARERFPPAQEQFPPAQEQCPPAREQ